nr:hypothetical protein [Planctomycetota bacterium]
MNVVHCSVFAVFSLASLSFADEPPMPIEPEAVSLGRPVEFSRDVRPILDANCTACHNISSDESDLSLETVEAMLKGGGRGVAVVPGKPDESLLLAVASHRREPVMPPPDNDVQAKNLSPRELGVLRQWILEGAAKGETSGSMVAWRPLPGGFKAIRSVALSPTSRFVAAARGNQVEVHDLQLGDPPTNLVDPNLASLTDGAAPLYPEGAADRDLVQAVAFSPDGVTLASGGYRAIKLWRRVGLTETKPLDLAGVNAVAASADGAILAVAVGNEVKIVTAADGAVSATWPVPAKATALAFSADGNQVAAACEDLSIHAWSRVDGQAAPPRMSPSPVTAIVFAGDRIVTASEVGILHVWIPGAEQPERELKGYT